MSLGVEGINGTANYLIDTAFKGISLAGESLSQGAALAVDGASWIGHQVVALTPVLKLAAATVIHQTIRVAKAVVCVALKAFSAASMMTKIVLSSAAIAAKKSYQVGLDGLSWIGHQVVALTPVLKLAAATVIHKTIQVAKTVACVALKAFSAASMITKIALSTAVMAAEKSYQIGFQFVKNNPRDIALSLTFTAVGMAIAFIGQKVFGNSKKSI